MPAPFLFAKTVPAGTVPIVQAQGGRMNVAKAAKKVLVYTQQGAPLGVVDASAIVLQSSLPPDQQAQAKARLAAIQKAAGKPLMPVYDANGQLVGMIDPKDLVEVQQATAPGAKDQAAADANAARVQAQSVQGQQQAAAEAVTKAVADVLRPVKPRRVGVAKSAPASGSIRDVFAALLKDLEPGRADALRATLSHQSLALMTGHGVPAPTAIAMVKKAAIRVARHQGLI